MHHSKLSHLLILAVFLSSLFTKALAQGDDVLGPCQSYRHKYTNIPETKSIVRSNDDYRVIHTQSKDYATGLTVHTFSILRYSSNIETYFTTTFGASMVNPFSVDITDMEIFEDICYFCGNKSHDIIEPTQIIHVMEGIVGFFTPASMHIGVGDLYTYDVPNTSQLTRLAISYPSQIISHINAIGILDDYSTSCMVEIEENAPASWTAILSHVSNIPEIHFSDILTTRDSIILLAQLKCANNHPSCSVDYDIRHQQFLLDRFSHYGCHHDCSPSSVTHYMAHYNLNDYAGFHVNKAPMALGRLNYNWFAVAFGVKEDETDNWGIRYFPFSNIWQYDSSIYYQTGTNATVIEIANRNLTSETFVLSTDNTNFNGIVTSPWLAGPPNNVRTLRSTSNFINSLTQKANTPFLEMTGHYSTSNLELFEQNVDSLHTPSCLTVKTKVPTVFPENRAALFYVNWELLYNHENVQWEKMEILERGKSESIIECKHCN